jgi:hypothetical protein
MLLPHLQALRYDPDSDWRGNGMMNGWITAVGRERGSIGCKAEFKAVEHKYLVFHLDGF